MALLMTVLVAGAGLAAWKVESTRQTDAAYANQPEPTMAINAAVAKTHQHRRSTTSIGTVLALRSITLRNEIEGTVERVRLNPGEIVDAGTVLVRFDVSVEEAELRALEAQAALAETQLERHQQASLKRAVSAIEVDRARAERDVALAQIARTRAIIARKVIKAPFRARVGLSDVHPGQYLDAGTELTTLQGVDRSAHVDFSVAQAVAAALRPGDEVGVFVAGEATPMAARIVAVDARIDATTRNAAVRARFDRAGGEVAPGASVRIEIPVGPPQEAVVVPASALRKGPGGDHVFALEPDDAGNLRARQRTVESGALLGDQVMILSGLTAGERVAASGSFKLFDGVLVAVVDDDAIQDSGAIQDSAVDDPAADVASR